MKICTVGTGRMAVAHSRALGALPDIQLHTVINPNAEYAEEFRQQHGYERAATSLEEVLAAGGFDAVVVCTPNALHASQSAAALAAGKHVLCEIPLALSLAETEELGRLAKARGVQVMACHTERYDAGRRELRRRIAAGEIHPLRVLARFFMLRRGDLKTEQAHHGWVDNVLWHHGCHVVDGVMHILGSHQAIGLSAQFGPPWPSLGTPLDVSLQWRAPGPIDGDEVLVGIDLSHNARWNRHDYRVIGLEDDLLCRRGALYNRDGVIFDPSSFATRIDRQDAEFVSAVRGGRTPELGIETVLPTMRILQAAWDVWLAREGA